MDRVETRRTVYETEKSVFRRMVVEKGVEPEVALKIMAMWMWLESQGCERLISKIRSIIEDEFLTSILSEAICVLTILKPFSGTPISRDLIPVTASLSNPCVSLNIIFARKEVASNGIRQLYYGISNMFEDLWEEKGGVKVGEVKRELGYGKSSSGFRLNPYAKEWDPCKELPREEDRCLFITFSKGYPITEQKIFHFFNQRFGPCVDKVYVHHRGSKDEPPLFGKVLFKASYIPVAILNGQDEARFVIGRKPLWCKKYSPKKKFQRRR